MPELDDAVRALAAWLDREQVPHMVIGGFAVTVWGEPRFTRDLDVTVSVPPEKLGAIVGLISSQFTPLVANPMKFVTETRVLPIMVQTVPVNLVFAALPYEEAAIARARKLVLKNGSVQVCSPEDLILYKIVSDRAREHDDIEGVFRYRHSELDYAYVDPRVEELASALANQNMLEWYRALRQRWA